MFTSQSLTRSGALNTNTGCQECVRVFVCTVSEQEHTWDAVSGGPKSLSCFRAPLSGSSPALATLHPFVMYLCIDRKGDGSGCQSAVTRNPPPPPPSVSQRRRKNPSCPSDRARRAHVRLQTWLHAHAALGQMSSSNAYTWALFALVNVNISPTRLKVPEISRDLHTSASERT